MIAREYSDKQKEAVRKLKDPKYFLENHTKIKGKTAGHLINFKLNEAQKDLFNTLKRYARVIILKARQLGFSTGVVGYFYHRTIFTPSTNTALIGYNSELTAELLDKIKTLWRTTPEKLRPTLRYNSKYEISFPVLESKVIVLPASKTVGRGYTLHNCLAAETEVVMEDFTTKSIEDVRTGDSVITGTGSAMSVASVSCLNTNRKMVDIDVYGANKLTATDDHLFLCRERLTGKAIWKKAGEIKVGDYVAYPLKPCRNRIKTTKLPSIAKKGYESRSNGNGAEIKLNYEAGRFIGWYLAEGTVNKGKISFAIHKDEVDEVLEAIEPMRRVLGKVTVRYHGENGATVDMSSKALAKWLTENFGKGAESKFLSSMSWNSGYEFAYGILAGLVAGDGCVNNDKKIQIVTTSERLARGVKHLMVSARIGLASVRRSESYRYGVKGLDRYDITIGGKGNYKLRRKIGLPLPKYDNARAKWRDENVPFANQGGGQWLRGKEYYWAKVRNSGLSDYHGKVYDIGFSEEPHSFLTTAGIVHNCLATEAAFWDDAEEKLAILEASVPEDGKLVIETTPSTVGTAFHRKWSVPNDYAKKEYGWWWGYNREEIDKIRRNMADDLRFFREYELEFDSTGMNVFQREIIRAQRSNVKRLNDRVELANGEFWTVKQMLHGLRVYRPPQTGTPYVIGADIAEGVEGGDYSVAVVIDKLTGEEVAFWRGHVAPDKFGEMLCDWGRYYNTALVAPEVNNHGLTTVTILKQKFYPNIYVRPKKYDVPGMDMSQYLGWKTTQVTRPMLIDDFATAIGNKDIIIRSKEILDEMMVFVYNKNMKPVAETGWHDDTIFAAGIGVQALKMIYSGDTSQIAYENYLPSSTPY